MTYCCITQQLRGVGSFGCAQDDGYVSLIVFMEEWERGERIVV